MSADGLPPLREVVAEHGLAARRGLGQNFLFDLNLTGRIARAAGPLDGHAILEVGPGPGGLTRALLAEGAGRVVALERDPRFRPALDAIAAHWPGRLEIVEGDALRLDPRALLGPGPARVAANLPYNVATPLLVDWLTRAGAAAPGAWPPWWGSLTVMVQREVAERLVAGPEDRANHGRLGVLVAARARGRILFDVSPAAFTPPPKVVSTVVRIEPRADAPEVEMAALEAVTASAFGQRRKTLRRSLRAAFGEGAEAAARAAGLDPGARAEEVEVAGFVALAGLLAARRRGG